MAGTEIHDLGQQHTFFGTRLAAGLATLVGFGRIDADLNENSVPPLSVNAFGSDAARIRQRRTRRIYRLRAIAQAHINILWLPFHTLEIGCAQPRSEIDEQCPTHDQFVAGAVQRQPAPDPDLRARLLAAVLPIEFAEFAAQDLDLGVQVEVPLRRLRRGLRRRRSCGRRVGLLREELFQFLPQRSFFCFFGRGTIFWQRHRLDEKAADHAVAMQAPVMQFQLLTEKILLRPEVLGGKQLAIEIFEPPQLRNVEAR